MISRNHNHNLNRNLNLAVLWILFCAIPAFSATNAALALRYARIYERELVGEHAGLVAEYRTLFSDARETDKELAEKSLYRIGMCEKKAGQLNQARAVWRDLVERFPLSDPVVSSAREALKALEWELDRIVIEGNVVISSVVTGVPPAGKCVVFAGEWGNEPPVLTSLDGGFRMGRRAAGQLPDGRSYGLIYAAHASRPLVGADVWCGGGVTGITVSLAAPVAFAGKVVDRSGNPVAGVRVRVTGYKTVPGSPAAPVYTVPMPMDRLISPVWSGSNGAFSVEGLPAGLGYELAAETREYRVIMEGAMSGSAEGALSQPVAFSNLLATITWLRGNPETGVPLRWDELRGRVVVFHFGSAYGEASVRAQYPEEGGALSRLVEFYGPQAVWCLWLLPEGEGRGDAAQLALGLYPEIPVGSGSGATGRELWADRGPWAVSSGQSWNVVMGRDGRVQAVCSDQQVFRVVNKALE